MKREQIAKLLKDNFNGTNLANLRIRKYAETILLVGSYGRNTADSLSDVDIVIIVKDDSKFNIQGKYLLKNIIFDFRTEKESEIKSEWSDQMNYAYFNSYIVLDKNSKFKKILKNKIKDYGLRLSEKIAIELVELSVLFLFEDNWRRLRFQPTHLIKAYNRNRNECVAYIQNVIIERIINLFYLVNSCPPPDKKNRLYSLRGLIPIKTYKLLVRSLCLKNIKKKHLLERDSIISELVNYLKERVDKILPYDLNLRKIYLEKRS